MIIDGVSILIYLAENRLPVIGVELARGADETVVLLGETFVRVGGSTDVTQRCGDEVANC